MSGEPEPRFDIVHHDHGGLSIDYHFCREWDGDVGCYGTNPDHGYSFKEVAADMRRWHLEHAEYWATVTLEQWQNAVAPTPQEGE